MAGASGPIPRLLLIADGFVTGRVELDATTIRRRTVSLVEAGVPWVSLRDHDADRTAFASVATELARAVRDVNPDVLVSVHGRLAVALDIGAGLHVGRRGASLRTARESALVGPLGVSAHSASAALRAAKEGAAYATLSPVFATRTHPDAVPAGIDPLRLAAERSQLPILALGGMTPPRARIARLVGAHGAAVISSLLFAFDERKTVRQFLNALGATDDPTRLR
ncbi:thiamine phosphate synthase [Rubrivirga sp. IMCC43871]|uniref:thiamine phosphate synthase n=1 Tax=Rubrivirga sp. IMCC43871 TaxID=3391575 RepID=UPI00398FAF63